MRHARTAGNAENKRMGRDDVPLDDVGLAQATDLAHALRHERIDVIHSSPLQRARQTAAPLAAPLGLAVVEVAELLEMDFGPAAVDAAAGTKLKVKTKHRHDPLPGGESMFDVWERCGAYVERIVGPLAAGASVLAVGHYRLNQLLAGRLLGLDFDTAVDEPVMRPENASAYALVPSIGACSWLWEP